MSFIIIYADNDSLTVPYQWDVDCEGAIHAWDGESPVAQFENRKQARHAIAVSTAWHRLKEVQGEIANSDFTDPKCRKNLRIVPLKETL